MGIGHQASERGHAILGLDSKSPFRIPHWWRLLALLAVTLLPANDSYRARAEVVASREHRPPRDFAEGVRIDWQQGIVEVQAMVVLRQGLLELVACSPDTREHESILRVAARPRDIFQAMGLVGLVPGRPVRHDIATDRWLPTTGPAVRIDVRYRDQAEERTVPIEQWLRRPGEKENQKSDPLNWVFAGSQTSPDGTFGADVEGTVICVVDFSTALIGVGALHSASDDELWLAANTKRIPPIGTSCTLLIARASPRPIVVELEVDGTLRQDRKAVSVSSIVQAAVRKGCDKVSGGVVLQADQAVSDDALNKAVKALVDKGLRRETIRVLRPTTANAQ